MRSNASSRKVRIVGALASFLMAALFVGLYAGLSRAAGSLMVEIDQVTLIRLDKPGAEVIIGNPSIADVSVQNSRLLAVTGKSAGLTNIMVLDGSGNLTYSKKVFVSADALHLVTLNKGTARMTYSCSPVCGPALIPGDAEEFFQPLAKEIRNKLGLAQSAVDGTTTQK